MAYDLELSENTNTKHSIIFEVFVTKNDLENPGNLITEPYGLA